MRIDKYLQMTRIIKRRVVAKEISDAGQVVVNGKKVKPSYVVTSSDVIDLYLGQHILSVEVVATDEKLLRKNPDDCFKIIRRSLNVN